MYNGCDVMCNGGREWWKTSNIHYWHVSFSARTRPSALRTNQLVSNNFYQSCTVHQVHRGRNPRRVVVRCLTESQCYKRSDTRMTAGGGDSSVVRAPDSWLKGRGFESLLERRENFLLFSRVDFLCWLLFRYPFHPRVTTVARKKSRSFCQKCRWQVTAKHAYTLRMWILLNRASALVTTCP